MDVAGVMPLEPSPIGGLIAYEAISRSIVARHLQTELAHAECVDWGERPAEAGVRLADLTFDQAPATRDGKLVGYVVQRELVFGSGQRLAPYVHPLGPDTLTSASASVLEVMEALLPGVPLTFVVDGHRISGFVTPSDLNKHPARAHFYLLLADLEIALVGLVREYFKNPDDAVALLPRRSQGVVRKRFRSDQQNKLETNLVTGMDLAHLLRIVGRTEALRTRFGADDQETWDIWTHGFRALRDAVMHPSLEFLGASRSLEDLVAAEARIRALLQGAVVS